MSHTARNQLPAKRGLRAQVFAALGDPTRLTLVTKLCGGPPCSISKLTQDTKLTRQAVTKHLQVLAQAHIVSSKRAGRETRFAFNPAPIEDIKKYLQIVSAQWDDALSRLRTFVER